MDTNSPLNWPPVRQHTRTDSPSNHLAPVHSQKQYRSGYEVKPKAPSFKPYALNNPAPLQSVLTLDPDEWRKIAVENKLLPPDANLHSFQIQVCNYVLMNKGDCVLISPTGSGKSLTWTLPLAARDEGISLVITPFTSLGQEGELRSQTGQISSVFIYSEQNSQDAYEKAAQGEMMVVYVCPETLESPSFARLLHSDSWQKRLSAIYVDEAHLVHQTRAWRPSYARIYQLRNIIRHQAFRTSLITYAGLNPDYTLINLGNFRPELSIMIVPMEHDMQSFLDIAFILPLGCKEADLVKTIVFCDDLDRLTEMFWWAFSRAAYMQLPTHVVDIIHSGLSSRHQEMALQDFRNGKTQILLGSSKIIRRVIQFGCRDLTIPDADQRRGRGARQEGEQSVAIFFVEPSMLTGDITIDHPGDQDPGMIELILSEECAEKIIQKHLGNTNDCTRHASFPCCNRCDPNYRPSREYKWVEFSPAPATNSRETIYKKLIQWRLEHWKKYTVPDRLRLLKWCQQLWIDNYMMCRKHNDSEFERLA
ncbi:P-loop containing nucleoside triphosphate hydrolase protein [Mycena leptocephala]|nr:P-loop containing nucleoside triphosphate hydrolase protein [Mycena leptocephala]